MDLTDDYPQFQHLFIYVFNFSQEDLWFSARRSHTYFIKFRPMYFMLIDAISNFHY